MSLLLLMRLHHSAPYNVCTLNILLFLSYAAQDFYKDRIGVIYVLHVNMFFWLLYTVSDRCGCDFLFTCRIKKMLLTADRSMKIDAAFCFVFVNTLTRETYPVHTFR